MGQKYQRSFLKWPGSKFTLLSRLFKSTPKSGDTLIESFAGSCTFAINTNYKNYIINDFNADLIEIFKLVVADPLHFIESAKILFTPENNNAESYYKIRTKYNSSTNASERALYLLYLNKHGYNGLMRYNKSGGFNVPFGKYKKPRLNEQAIMFFSDKFKNALFLSGDFEAAMNLATPNSVVFSDPPYFPLNKTSNFVGYTGSGFDIGDQKRLNAASIKCKNIGARAFVCNHNVPLTHQTYSDATTSVNFLVKRSIAADKTKRKRAKETFLIY